MAQFDAKIFNAEVFSKYLERVPRVKQNKLLEAGVLRTRGELKTMLNDQTGGNYITVPMKGLLDGTPLNYDGATDITATNTKTFSQSMVVVGRAKGWTEKDFSADVTGQDFMDNVAQQVATYWDDVDQDTLLAVLTGIFSMSGAGNLTFVTNHTTDLSGGAGDAAKVNVTTLNSAIQKAAGDNKGIFKLVVCHSAVATNLENLGAVTYLKYTDAKGVERDLGMATWNGRLVLIDDSVPVTTVSSGDGIQGVYTLTVTGAAAAGDKISFDGIEYEVVASGATGNKINAGTIAEACTALQAKLATQYSAIFTVTKTATTVVFTQKVNGYGAIPSVVVTAAETTGTLAGNIAASTDGAEATSVVKYTTYTLGDGAFDFVDCGAKVPNEMSRDPKTNGGEDTLYTRQRKVFAPRGISFLQTSMASASPTDAELRAGANWALVNDGHASSKTYINHKAIPIARIISKG